MDPKRRGLLRTLAAMPDEAFGWFVAWAQLPTKIQSPYAAKYPDGLGGFQDESRASIAALRTEATKYINSVYPSERRGKTRA